MNGGVVLAAGASDRMGTPKPLLEVEGEPAVQRVARLLREAGCRDVVVVTGAHADDVRRALPAFARAAHNAAWPRGQTTSVKVGVAALDVRADIVVWPVDRMGVEAATVRALLQAAGPIRVPVSGGRRGHPVVFAAPLRHELLALADDEPLHAVVRRDAARVAEIPVHDAAVHINVDTPDDYARLKAHLAERRKARPVA